ncbi:MAG: S1C family serine protease [Rhodobacteraceae bacterium]|nr:S1C family serine protease [Paracoccaceae bacterium]
MQNRPSAPAALAALSDQISGLAAAAAPAVVTLRAGHEERAGFVWAEGLVVAAEETLPETGTFEMRLHDGRVLPAVLAGRDPTTDVALLRAEGTPAPTQAAAAAPRPGALTLVLGAGGIAALGMVALAAGPWRSMRGGEIDARIELDLRLHPGLEGGLALAPDGSGTWGMVVAGPRRTALVIPHSTISRVAAALRDHGRIARGYLGLGLQPVEVEGEGRPGAIVVTVDPGGPAARAGLRQGDVVVALGDTPVTSTRQLLRALGPGSVGQRLEIDVRRAGEVRRMSVTIAERPE